MILLVILLIPHPHRYCKNFFRVFDHPSIIFGIDQSESLKENSLSKSHLWTNQEIVS